MGCANRVFEYGGCWLHRRRDTPNFHIYWCRPGTRRVRRRSAGTGDLEAAKRVLIQFADGRAQPKRQLPGAVSVLAVLTDYAEPIIRRTWHGCAERTALLHWSEFLQRADVASVADLTLDVQNQYIEWRRGCLLAKGHSASNGTLGRELGVMRAAIRAAWKRGQLDQPVFVTSLPQPPPRQRFLFADEARRLLDACRPPHLRTFVTIALHTLQRPGAILGLRCEQVKFAEGLIDFLPEEAMQTKKRRPVVPISDALRPVLKDAIANSRTGHVVEFRGRPVRCVKRSFADACAKAGLEHVSPYVLRHTGATLLLASGVPIRQVAGMLGHTEQQTTERYGKHHPSFLKEATMATDRLFGATHAATAPPATIPAVRLDAAA